MSTKKIFFIAMISFLILILVIGTVVGIIILRNSSSEADTIQEMFYYNVGDIYSNLKNSKRIVKIKLTVEVTDEKFMEELAGKVFLIKNEVNSIIRNKEEKDIEGSEGQLLLRVEITRQLGTIFSTDKVSNIFFEELIVQ